MISKRLEVARMPSKKRSAQIGVDLICACLARALKVVKISNFFLPSTFNGESLCSSISPPNPGTSNGRACDDLIHTILNFTTFRIFVWTTFQPCLTLIPQPYLLCYPLYHMYLLSFLSRFHVSQFGCYAIVKVGFVSAHR